LFLKLDFPMWCRPWDWYFLERDSAPEHFLTLKSFDSIRKRSQAQTRVRKIHPTLSRPITGEFQIDGNPKWNVQTLPPHLGPFRCVLPVFMKINTRRNSLACQY
jgi:hypothetical protein